MTSPEETNWEHFYHQADIGIRGFGPTIDQAFTQAAIALINVITSVPINPDKSVVISCQADNPDDLLYDWLNQLIFQIATDKFLYSRFEVRIVENKLTAVIWGEPIDIKLHQPIVEIKAATYTELKVEQDATGQWLAETVIDV